MTTTLLAVDDSKTMRKVIQITFAGEGFKTVVAETADDALGKVRSEQPQVALVDASLEGTNGYDLCRQIKGTSPSTLVILLSNKAQPYDKARGAAAGADDFMDKPFDTQQMIDKVGLLVKRGATATAAAPAGPAAPVVPPPAVQPVGARPFEAPGQRPRVQTLAYGSAPLASSPAAPPKPATSPFASRQPFPAPSTPAAAEPPRPAPSPAAPPVAAPAPVASSGTNGLPAEFATKLGGIGLTPAQVEAVLALSREVVEKVVWEVVPTLAEALIKEEIQRLTKD